MRCATFALALLAALTVAVGVPARAAAKSKPCWEKVIDDYNDDEQIEGHYSVKCYRQALANLPGDLSNYSPIGDEIRAAMLAAIGGKHGKGGGPSDNATKDAHPSQGLISRILGAFGANGAHKMPLPLVLLAVLAIVVGVAAAYPRLARRLRTRPPRLRPAPDSERP